MEEYDDVRLTAAKTTDATGSDVALAAILTPKGGPLRMSEFQKRVVQGPGRIKMPSKGSQPGVIPDTLTHRVHGRSGHESFPICCRNRRVDGPPILNC
jgi:hypothetical protein